jgi:hypothetical protein
MRPRQLLAWVFLGLLFVAVNRSSARTWSVPTDAPTIQAGIDSALAGDTVSVDCGTYYEYNINMKSGVTLRSATGSPDCVTIDANSLGRVMTCNGTNNTTWIVGLTMIGGSTNYGGGMFIGGGSPLVSDCVFRENNGILQGGGMSIESANPTLTDCVFYGNTSVEGGGIYFYDPFDPRPHLIRCTIAWNSAPSGAGVYMYVADPGLVIDNTIIAFNQGPSAYGGGWSPMTNCTNIFGNTGGDWVNNIYYWAGQNGNVSVDPEFCDLAAGDLHLTGTSPCLSDFSACGQMGALGRGCFGETARVVRVARCACVGSARTGTRLPTRSTWRSTRCTGGRTPSSPRARRRRRGRSRSWTGGTIWGAYRRTGIRSTSSSRPPYAIPRSRRGCAGRRS